MPVGTSGCTDVHFEEGILHAWRGGSVVHPLAIE